MQDYSPMLWISVNHLRRLPLYVDIGAPRGQNADKQALSQMGRCKVSI